MIDRHPRIWKLLPLIALGLMLVRDFSSIPDSLDGILLGVAISILLTFSGLYFWQERRARESDQSNGAGISPGD